MNDTIHICPACEQGQLETFYTEPVAPANSVLLLNSREQALEYPRGEIQLGFCPQCGFISNHTFRPELTEYSGSYESTQSFSPTFDLFARGLAADLVGRYDLGGKQVLEIGCGNGEFLTRLCELGNCYGVGFDPAYQPGRVENDPEEQRLRFVADFYSEKYADVPADFVVCKMTLEHIARPAEFLRTVQRAASRSEQAVFFFQVPDVIRILFEGAFWDVYYEHCSYFSPASLTQLFTRHGFDVLQVRRAYDDQYLMIEARQGSRETGQLPEEFNPAAEMRQVRAGVQTFPCLVERAVEVWRHQLEDLREAGKKAVLWGAGSKGVAFLTAVGAEALHGVIEYCVDINPHKHGTFMAGRGQEIVSPEFLTDYRPEVVVVMNPVYLDEIGQSLNQMGLTPRLVSVNQPEQVSA